MIDDYIITINGYFVPKEKITFSPNMLALNSVLQNGKNDIAFTGHDTVGRGLYLKTTVWAGNNTLKVNLVNEADQPFLEAATVRVSLVDDQEIFAEGSTETGSISFEKVPQRTVLIRAFASQNRNGLLGVFASGQTVTIMMKGFISPSDIANNDFSQGTAGWETGTAPVKIVPHIEGYPSELPGTVKSLSVMESVRDLPPPNTVVAQRMMPTANSNGMAAASIDDNDLMLGTVGEGEQSIYRAFHTSPGTTAVRVRYRFITSEVPGGYFGTKYNDYFRVSLRSQQGGGYADEGNSMNGLGLGAFDYASGATSWRDVTLPIKSEDDVVEADVSVANVADGLYDSQVVVDFIEEVKDQVHPSLAWNNQQGGLDLTYTVEDGPLTEDTIIEVYFASGTGYENRLGSAVFTYTVPANTWDGQYGPVHIDGTLLADDPGGQTHLIAVASPTSVGAVKDVRLTFGPNANCTIVWSGMIDIIKDGQRAAGQTSAIITSTARTPAEDARVMYQNLVKDHNGGELTLADIQQGALVVITPKGAADATGAVTARSLTELPAARAGRKAGGAGAGAGGKRRNRKAGGANQ
jgi:hypothetical protein